LEVDTIPESMHGTQRKSLRRLLLQRAPIAALLAPALVLGALDLHSSASPHAAHDGPSVVLADARHPLAPEHLESSAVVRVPPCPACVLHSKSSCGAVAPPALEPEPVVLADEVAPPVALRPFSLAYGLGSRGPPLA
jgi:hypothetical protein